MSLSDNIKKMRLEKNMTQEQLAMSLGISAQAVSKWETRETYPDGSLLVNLSKVLEVSLDELFDNDLVSMPDTSRRIMCLLRNTDIKEQFNVVRDICWQIERGLFDSRVHTENKYDPNDIKSQTLSSYILDKNGFTNVSNGKEPFFSVFPKPEDGFGHFLESKEEIQKIFAALSRENTIKAIVYLYRKAENYVFESTVLAKECDIPDDKIDDVMEDLITIYVVKKQELTINGEYRVLYSSTPNHKLIAVFLMAKELCYKRGHCVTFWNRKTPFFQE